MDYPVLTADVKIHVQMAILVLRMLNVGFPTTDLFVSVHQDGEVTLRFAVINRNVNQTMIVHMTRLVIMRNA
jgi:hypothetical protein